MDALSESLGFFKKSLYYASETQLLINRKLEHVDMFRATLF